MTEEGNGEHGFTSFQNLSLSSSQEEKREDVSENVN